MSRVQNLKVAGVSGIPATSVESRAKLAQHMAVLQSFGHTDLSTVGTLTVGSPGNSFVGLKQKRGVLLPSAQGPVSAQTENVVAARKCTSPGNFQNISGSTKVLNTQQPSAAGKTERNALVINSAYWFGTQINIQDDTTIILHPDVKSLFIIAQTLNIGQRVTITWERSALATPSVPQKPATPPELPQATTVGTLNGSDGTRGNNGAAGYNGQPAPEIELWFLQANGYPAIDLRGQDGTVGGRGGDGGDGARGQKGCNTEKKNGFCHKGQGGGGNGGNGGRAGDGGRGGDGGTGGRFDVYTLQNSITAWLQNGLTISVDGGGAGAGGDAGRAGEGGQGGEKGERLHTVCAANDRTPGLKGNTGASGLRGPDGNKGVMQSNSIRYTPITATDFYIELTKPAITTVYPTHAFVGDTMTLNGLRFAVGDKVMMEGYDGNLNVECPTTFVSDSLMSFVVPSVPGGYASFEVMQVDGTRSSNKGTLTIKPRIIEIFPGGRIKPGKYYFLRGTGLGRSGRVWMNGEEIGAFTTINDTTIKFKAKRPTNAEVNAAGENCTLRVVNDEGAIGNTPNYSPEINVVLDTFQLAVCGDSMMFNGGVPEHQKYYSLAADYISAKLGNQTVHRLVKAHHGAKIGRGDNTVKPEMPGEMSSRYPTTLQQLDATALSVNAPELDVLFLCSGANDLPITDVMLTSDLNNLSTVKANLIANVKKYCYDDMIFMLQKAASQYPKATIIVPGYFHIFSDKSNPGAVKAFFLSCIENVNNIPGWPTPPEGTVQKIIILADTWIAESTKQLKAAVQYVNDNLTGDPRIFFVSPETTPENAAHAPNSLVWEPDSFGDPTDPMWKGGREAQRDANKSRLQSEASTLGNGYFMTKRNSSYHANIAGSNRYFEKTKPILDKMAVSTTSAFRCPNGAYWSAEGGGNGTLIAQYHWLAAWETFDMIDLGGGKVALRSINGQYVCAENGGGSTVNINRSRIGDWETFTLVAGQGKKVSFKTFTGKYLTLPANSNTVGATASQITATELFELL